ncbi:unnamed protein product [Cuscuta epithymum]|uniref:Uncharacterized protein n=1 Tax=Cuscuta epithymum TaxID=186058 RepID=A0AAV0ER09_9ASTE|nr:unnamed protein product [Cuscuta epithymum]CAH9125592.1 unnamed protein product [Cuscuta epithymum]
MPPTLTPDRSVGLRRSRRNMKSSRNLIQDSSVVSIEDSGQESEGSKAGACENADAYVPMQVVFPTGENSQTGKRPSQSVATSSSNSKLPPTDYELLTMASRKKRVPSKLPSPLPKIPKHSTAEAAQTSTLPRGMTKPEPSPAPVRMVASFSSEFCRLKDTLLMKDEMAQVLLPSSSAAFQGLSPAGLALASSALAFQVLYSTSFNLLINEMLSLNMLNELGLFVQSTQASLVAAERLTLMEKTIDDLKMKEITMQKYADANARQILELQEQNSAYSAQVSLLKDRILALEAYGRKKKQEVTNAACFYAWKTRGELMEAFLAGETSGWKAEQDVASWRELQEEMDPPIADDGFDVGESDNEADS